MQGANRRKFWSTATTLPAVTTRSSSARNVLRMSHRNGVRAVGCIDPAEEGARMVGADRRRRARGAANRHFGVDQRRRSCVTQTRW